MKIYRETMTCSISPELAWKALQDMNIWLPQLSTNRDVIYEQDEAFLYQGRIYQVVTTEGLIMDSEIYKVDEDKHTIEIHASHSILRSILTCSVEAIDDAHCSIIRTQAYPGWFGWIFTRLFNKREAGETSEYLQTWARYAESLEN